MTAPLHPVPAILLVPVMMRRRSRRVTRTLSACGFMLSRVIS